MCKTTNDLKEHEGLNKIVHWICESYESSLVSEIKENKNNFPYTIAVSHFIEELSNKGINIKCEEVFYDKIIDNILKEFQNYLKS